MACSTLPLKIASKQLTRCYYVALCCPEHGEIRACAARFTKYSTVFAFRRPACTRSGTATRRSWIGSIRPEAAAAAPGALR